MNIAYRYRIYPTDAQKVMFAKTFGCARFIYNKMLADRLAHYNSTGKKLNNTPTQYKDEFPWLKEVDSLALANAQLNLNKAYNNFFSNLMASQNSNQKNQGIYHIQPIIKRVRFGLKETKSNCQKSVG